MPKALQHNYPGWQDDPHAEDSNGEPREVWFGVMRVVSAKRARKLRKRGVPLMPLHAVYLNPCDAERGQSRAPLTPGNGPGKRSARYAWFEPEAAVESRTRSKALRCYLVATRPQPFGRKGWLRERLHTQRERLRLEVVERWTRRAWRHSLDTTPRKSHYAGVIHENVLNPQLDLYARAFELMHWTNAQKRQFLQQGYVVESGPDLWVDERTQRKSPAVLLTYRDSGALTRDEVRELVPPQYINEPRVCPTCEGDPVALDGSICSTCDGACVV
jgi:hypothetical protein